MRLALLVPSLRPLLCSLCTPLRAAGCSSSRLHAAVIRKKRGLSTAVYKQCRQSIDATSAPADLTSTSNEYVKHCCKLRTALKYRQAQHRALIIGIQMLEEVASISAALQPLKIHTLLVAQASQPPAGVQADRVITVADNVMKKLCGLENTAGVQVVAEVDTPKKADLAAYKPRLQRLLALEGLQDPGNLGTLLRTAVALGWDACFLLPGCCDPFNDKALKAGRGAAFKLPLAQGDWQELHAVLRQQDLQCFGACPDTTHELEVDQHQSSGTADLPWADKQPEGEVRQGLSTSQQAVCLVLGSEGQGLSTIAMQYVKPISIAMPGPMESLNVSQAGAILMFALSGASRLLVQRT